MPESLEIKVLIALLILKLLGRNFIIRRFFVSSLKHKAFSLLRQIKYPFSIAKIQQKGKEIGISTSNDQYIVMRLCSGSYFKLVKTSKLGYYPYDSLSGVIFYGSIEKERYSLVFLDCEQFKNFPTWTLFNGKSPKWSDKCGPCVLTQHIEFLNHFRNYWKNHSEYFKQTSIVKVLFNSFLFNGLGQYSISEILHRLYLKFNIQPWDNSFDCFTRYSDSILGALLIFEKEIESFNKYIDPAAFGIKQKQLRTEFRLHLLQVYRKPLFKGQLIYFFAVKVDGGSFKTLYTMCLHPNLPTQTTSKSKKEQNAFVSMDLKNERWFRIRGIKMTTGALGVGIHDWHSKKAQQLLLKAGLPDPHKKGPQYTPPKSNKNKHPHSRSGKRGIKIKRQKFQSGENY